MFDIGYHLVIFVSLSKCGLLLLYVWFVCDRYRLHIIDLDPASVTSGGWLEDTSLVEKYTISDEAYNKLDGIAWTTYCHVLQLLYCVCMQWSTFHISSHILGTFRKFKEKLASQNPTFLENKVSFFPFFISRVKTMACSYNANDCNCFPLCNLDLNKSTDKWERVMMLSNLHLIFPLEVKKKCHNSYCRTFMHSWP